MCCDTVRSARINQLRNQITFLQERPYSKENEILIRELVDEINQLRPKIKRNIPPPPTYPKHLRRTGPGINDFTLDQ